MHTPTAEQALIIHTAKTTSDNILINALAGSAKTTSLEMVCHAISSIPILFLAFNKRIADEASKRLPGHVEVRTLNALGHRVWGATCGRKLSVDGRKMHGLLKSVIEALPTNRRGEAFSLMADTLDALRAAKRDGYVPPSYRGIISGLVGTFEEWVKGLDEDPTTLQRQLIDETLSASIATAYEGGLDFDDQVYMPVIFGGQWPKFPLVMIDEAQDLSPLNHEMLDRLVYKRIIAVGDPWQSIYGFRGAVANGMRALSDRFGMRELTLSVTFRVPQSGVIRARARVPHYKWPEGECEMCKGRKIVPDMYFIETSSCPTCFGTGSSWPLGEVISLPSWTAADVPDHAAIICRNNAPLFTCALRLLTAGRAIKLVGMDIGPGLVRTLKRLGPLTASNLEQLISEWQSTELKKAKNPDKIYDKAECLSALCAGRKTLAEAVRWTEDLFKQDGPIQLLSGHKAKGCEWDTVFHLDSWRIPSKFTKPGTEAYEQELNVRYVIETRFKERLVLVDLEGLNG